MIYIGLVMMIVGIMLNSASESGEIGIWGSWVAIGIYAGIVVVQHLAEKKSGRGCK